MQRKIITSDICFPESCASDLGTIFAGNEATPETLGGVDPLALYKFKFSAGKVLSSSFIIFEGRSTDSIGSEIKLVFSANRRGKFEFVLLLWAQVESPAN